MNWKTESSGNHTDELKKEKGIKKNKVSLRDLGTTSGILTFTL